MASPLQSRPSRIDLIGPPSPVRRLAGPPGLPSSVALWIKDDGVLGRQGGGTKLRNLEFLLRDALDRGAKGVVALGLERSNFIRTVARYAPMFDLPVTALVVKEAACGNRAAAPRDLGRGVTIRPVTMAGLGCVNRLVHLLGPSLGGASRSYWLPVGGASVVGCQGPLLAALELHAQIAAGAMPSPKAIVLPLGSAGTIAGLAAGLRLAGFEGRLIGLRVCGGPGVGAVARLSRRALAMRSQGMRPIAFTIDSVAQHVGNGSRRLGDVIASVRQSDGLELDEHYTGPAMAGLSTMAGAASLKGDILFWNTRSRSMGRSPTPLETAIKADQKVLVDDLCRQRTLAPCE